MIRYALAFALGFAGGFFFHGRSHAHDIYTNQREKGLPTGFPCCGGDPETGDCEAVQYRMLPNGDAVVTSNRYKRQVLIAGPRIAWMTIPGGEWSEAHWCGKPRSGMTSAQALPPDADQPDPETWT
jgi:hypothetical protein